MTVTSTNQKVQFNGTGSTTVFAYNFKIFAQTDLSVILRSAAGTETVQQTPSNYTVSGVGAASGGNVTMGVAPPSGTTLTILRVQPNLQGLDLVPNDPFPAGSMEDALDKLTFMVQTHDEEIRRSIKASKTNTIGDTEFTTSATDRANKLFSFDGSGNLQISQELGTYKGNWAASTAYAVRDLVKDTSTNNIFIAVTAHTSSGSQPLTTNTDSAKWALIVDAASATTSASTATTKANEAAASATLASQWAIKTDGTVDGTNYSAKYWATSSDVIAVAGKATEIGRLGTSDAVADMAILGTSDVVSDMNTLGTAAIVEDMNLLGTSANVTAMGVLGTSANVTAMAAIAGSSSVEIPALTVKAGNGADGNFFLIADNSDDAGDDWLIAAKHDPLKTLQITNNFGTSGGVMLTLTNSTNLTSESTAAFAGTVEVGNSVKFENSINGSYSGSVTVKSGNSSNTVRTITLPDLSGTVALTSQLSGPGFQLPTAAASTLGGIKVGTNLSIDSSGVLSSTNTTDVVSDTSPQLGGNLDVQAREIITSTSNGNVKITPNGSGVVEVKGAGGNDGTLQLNCSANSHGVKIKSPPHSAGASYTLTLPNTDGSANQVLKTDGSGNLDWVAQSVADGAVTTAKIADSAVTTAKIADSAVTTAKINADAVTNAKLADNSVDSEQYVDGSIDTAHIADSQITVAKMAANSVDSAQYVDGSIDTANIADANVTQAKIAAQAINESKLQVSNAPTNGYFLSAQSGNTGGLTWAAASGGADLYAANPNSATDPTAGGRNSVSIGSQSEAAGIESLAAGFNATSTGYRGLALGHGANAGNTSVSLGTNTTSASEGVALGRDASAGGAEGNALGHSSVVGGNGSRTTAIGKSYAAGAGSLAGAIAYNTSSYGATAANSVAIGLTAKATGAKSLVIGGEANIASAVLGTVVGGANNTASHNFAFVAGSTNTGSGFACTVTGRSNTASGFYASAFGFESKATIFGQTARAAGKFAAVGDAQGSTFILRSDTTDATAEAMTTNNSTAAADNQIVAASDTCITFSGTIVAMQNGAQAYAGFKVEGILVNDGGTTTLPASTVTTINNASSWGLALSADNTNNALKIQVTGEASHNIRWVANVQTAEVTYA